MDDSRIDELKQMLADLIWLNGVVATELIQATENSSKTLRGEIPESCLVEHRQLREQVMDVLERHCPEKAQVLGKHVLKHGSASPNLKR